MIFKYELEPRETVEDKLRRTQEELGRHSKLARMGTIKASVLSLVFGMALGAFGMVYFEQPKPHPVVSVGIGDTACHWRDTNVGQLTADDARSLQRVKELRK